VEKVLFDNGLSLSRIVELDSESSFYVTPLQLPARERHVDILVAILHNDFKAFSKQKLDEGFSLKVDSRHNFLA